MKNIIKTIILLSFLFSFSYKLKAQEETYERLPLQKYMYGAITFNSLPSVPSSNSSIGFNYNIGLTQHFGRFFVDAALGLDFNTHYIDNSAIFVKERTNSNEIREFAHLGNSLGIKNANINIPINGGASFIIPRFDHQIDVYAGLMPKIKFWATIDGYILETSLYNQKNLYSASDKDFYGNNLLARLNLDTQLGIRYWFWREMFVVMELRYDLFDNVTSPSIKVGQNTVATDLSVPTDKETYSFFAGQKYRSITDYNTSALSFALGFGYSF